MHSLVSAYTQQRVLIDCNSFFASCEVLRNPRLRWKPVCVGKQWNIVIAATYEAKAYGVRTGTPYREAKKILPKEAVFLEGDMRWYGEVSNRLMSYLREQFHSVYPASIDEAFLHMTDTQEQVANWVDWCRKLKESVLHDVGVPVSVGMSVSKILAKLCSEQYKPLGEHAAMSKREVHALLKRTSLNDITFIGKSSAEKLSPFCTNAYEFIQLSPERVKYLLGSHGLKVRYELHGVSLTVKRLAWLPKSIWRSRSFNPHFTSDKHVLRWYLLRNFEKARRELHEKSLQTRKVSVSLKWRSFRTWKAKKSLSQPIASYDILLTVLKELFDSVYQPSVLMRSTWVRFTELTSARYSQWTLFGQHVERHRTCVDATVHQINDHIGTWTVVRASQKFWSIQKKTITFEDWLLSCK